MASVYPRKNKLWCSVKRDGKWRGEATPYRPGQEVDAEKYAEQLQKLYDDQQKTLLDPNGPLTVTRWANIWAPKRASKGFDWLTDMSRLKTHVLPKIGHRLITDVSSAELVTLFQEIRTAERAPGALIPAPNTVYGIYGTTSALFRDAKAEGRIPQSPCDLTSVQLGDRVDADPQRATLEVFSRTEATILISDVGIPLDRRVVYALGLLAGMRPGEICALCWRHYDETSKPLKQLKVEIAFRSKFHAIAGTKTKAVRYVPVHPTLDSLIIELRDVWWPATYGRRPGPDDLIVPLPPTAAARRRVHHGAPHRSTGYIGRMWREVDLPKMGWRHREAYSTKATFITLILDDGADENLIENRVTHTPKSRGAFKRYNRGKQWLRTCAEIIKLNLTRQPCVNGALSTPLSTPENADVDDDAEHLETEEENDSGDPLSESPVEIRKIETMVVSDREDRVTCENRSNDVNPSELSRALGVESLATQLAMAIVVGDLERGQKLAKKFLLSYPSIESRPKRVLRRKVNELHPKLSKRQQNVLTQLVIDEKHALAIASGSDGVVSRNSVHMLMQSMESRGLVESRMQAPPKGARGGLQRLFRITNRGARALSAYDVPKLVDIVLDPAAAAW